MTVNQGGNEGVFGRPSLKAIIMALCVALLAGNWLAGTAYSVVQDKQLTLLGMAGTPTPSLTYYTYIPLIYNLYGTTSAAPFGIEIEDFTNAAAVQLASEAQAKWTRIHLLWADVEPERGHYDWAETDDVLGRVTAYGFTPVVVIRNTPHWAGPTLAGPIDDYDGFKDFLSALVQRYKDAPYRVKYWQLYNEPDISEAFPGGVIGGWGLIPDKYTEMLRLAYGTIKSVDPEAKVLIGGLLHDNSSWSFLDKVLDAGGGQYFDILCFHYYDEHNDDGRWGYKGLAGKAEDLQRRMESRGLHKPMMATEIGRRTWDDQDRFAEQANFVVRGYVQGMALGLQAIIWYSLVDPSFYYSGLVKADLTPKPAYIAYKTLTNELGSATYERPLTESETGSTSIEGYLFTTLNGKREIRVVWMKNKPGEPQEATMVVPAKQLKEISKLGDVTQLYAQEDGNIRVTIGRSPVYLEIDR
ncbi:MAG: glycoside hydrolase family 44 protein [Chloroflexi bacterium]|nr:glycoside hydrolase family 44 protein [Chloroflexota bacterium]MCL5074256.1 glycoside hydrolase family 44 protein [Chloroflexota bacterium]